MAFEFTYLADLNTGDEKEVEYIIQPGLLPKGGLMLITGDPGIGKSFLARQMGHEIACGRRLLGLFPTEMQIVAYMDTEKHSTVTRRRFGSEMWKKFYPDALYNFGFYDNETPMIDTARGLKSLIESFERFGAGTVIIDSFSMMLEDEGKRETLKPAIKNLRKIAQTLGIAIILIHHLVKRQKMINRQTNKVEMPKIALDDIGGAKFLQYEVDTVIAVETPSPERRNVSFLKHSYCPIPMDSMEPLHFSFNGGRADPFKYMGNEQHILDHLDRGDNNIDHMAKAMNVSSRTVKTMGAKLQQYGLLNVDIGTKGSGNSTGFSLPDFKYLS